MLTDVGRAVAYDPLVDRFAGGAAEDGISVLLPLVLQEEEVGLVDQLLHVDDPSQGGGHVVLHLGGDH